ncbi:hypothetical protein F4808DRAFT_286453 [Astrocystis sublimbata]|nr:hypothetical protein F4808DRAFT_286453 [Astrocystis sublimbata]
METMTPTSCNMNTPSTSANDDSSFYYSSTAPSPNATFSFSSVLDLEPTNQVMDYCSNYWSVYGLPNSMGDPIVTGLPPTIYDRPYETGFCTHSGCNTTFISDVDVSHDTVVPCESLFAELNEQASPAHIEISNQTSNNDNVNQQGTATLENLSYAENVHLRQASRKRAFSEAAVSDESEGTFSKACSRSLRSNSGERLFACPFYKRDAQQNQNCGGYILRRIKDVKQHIYRHHCRPENYCSRCFKEFESSNERDRHIREHMCALQTIPVRDDIISDTQKKDLQGRKSRKTGKGARYFLEGKDQQWMKLWDIIFPGTKRPRSPYVESVQADLLSSARHYWDDHADEIIARSIRKIDVSSLDLDGVKLVINIIFDEFETKLPNWVPATFRQRAWRTTSQKSQESLSEVMTPAHP